MLSMTHNLFFDFDACIVSVKYGEIYSTSNKKRQLLTGCVSRIDDKCLFLSDRRLVRKCREVFIHSND